MWCPHLSVIASAIFVPLAFCNFYDNPEWDLPSPSGTPLEELKAKWDFDVSISPSNFIHGDNRRFLRYLETKC